MDRVFHVHKSNPLQCTCMHDVPTQGYTDRQTSYIMMLCLQ